MRLNDKLKMKWNDKKWKCKIEMKIMKKMKVCVGNLKMKIYWWEMKINENFGNGMEVNEKFGNEMEVNEMKVKWK